MWQHAQLSEQIRHWDTLASCWDVKQASNQPTIVTSSDTVTSPLWPSGKASASRAGMLFVWCLTSQQHACVSQGQICSDNCTCCHTEIEAAHQTFYLTQSQYTDTRPISPSADPIAPGAWQVEVDEVESWICSFYLSVAARKITVADPSLRYASMFLGR